MKRLLVLMLAVAATAPIAIAQPQTEPRLAGGPQRDCTDDEIRQALDGSYAGPPCRFTEMPTGLGASPQHSAPQHPDQVRPARASAAAVQPRSVAQPQPVIRQPAVSTRSEARSYTASLQQSSTWQAAPAIRPAPPHRVPAIVAETVRLSDGFFSGGLVGGVERPFVPLYSYRGVILIAADGQVRTGHAGLAHRVGQVRALDNQAAPVRQPAARRSYPYP